MAPTDGTRGRRDQALEIAQELGYPVGKAVALGTLCLAAMYGGEYDRAVQLIRQAQQIPADVPGWIVRGGSVVLAAALNRPEFRAYFLSREGWHVHACQV